MLDKDSVLYLGGIVYNYYQQDFWDSLAPDVDSGGDFMLKLGKRYKPCRFISRNGEWSTPWPQEVPPMFRMPEYDPGFSKSYTEVTDERALEIKQLINEKNQKFAVMYSGGFDSNIIVAALIKNLTTEELKNIVLCCNIHSIIENPEFWKKHVWGKFVLFDSAVTKYDDLIEKGYRPITGDEGDSIFGTIMGLEFFQNYNYYLSKADLSTDAKTHLKNIQHKVTSPDVHFSEYKDLIIKQFALEDDIEFGRSWYEKTVHNINTATVPIQSLHDFYWWQIFNVKYVNCATRITVNLNDRMHCKEIFENWALNWYNCDGYQKWSMVNNNNGEKIHNTLATYKMASRKYLYDFDKNDWYFHFKLKIASLGACVVYSQELSHVPKNRHPNARFGLDKDYNTLYIDDPDVQDYIRYNMTKFKKDW